MQSFFATPLVLAIALITIFSGRVIAIRCYYCTTHDIATCERMATIVTCPVGFNRCYYSYSMWKPLPTTTTTASTTVVASGVRVKSLTSGNLTDIGGNSTLSDLALPPGILAEERRIEEENKQLHVVKERPPEIIDRPNGEDWEKIAQGCARAGVFPCSGSKGRGTRPEQDYCFGDLSYGNCIGIQCNNPGVTPLIFGNKATTLSILDKTVITISLFFCVFISNLDYIL